MASAITRQDIVSLSTYRQGRDEYVKKMIEYKRPRRVKLADGVSLLFENRNTVLFQIQELLNNEDLEDPKEIQEYIDIYSPMVPGPNELSATLFIEVDEQDRLKQMLTSLKGIERHLYLIVGDEKIQAVFEEEHDDREFTTSVHYLKFPLTDTAIAYLANGSLEHEKVRILLDHPALTSEVPLSTDTIAALNKDLATHQ
jgi:hypothetical protein